MSKELIVSVNGREKKIAIIENGTVTEFYIERGEGGQGVVGNLYKGRVMRVLPGMQSAFVDIGLERDAFLYVTDFFDEEEEFERIVVDKTKGGEAETARAAANEKIERARVERERQMESAHELALPEPAEGEEQEEGEARVEPAAAPAQGVAAPAQQAAEDQDDEGARRGRRRRGGKRGRDEREQAGRQSSDAGRPASSFEEGVRALGISREDIDTPFVAAADSFERVVDEDNAAAHDDGEMFKDARTQERIFDQIRASEFDMDAAATAEVGSLLGSAGAGGSSQFERVADDDDPTAGASPRQTRGVERAVAASVGSLADDLEGEAPAQGGAAQAFERVSDDEKAVESPSAGGARKGAARGAASKSAASKGASKKAASKKPLAAGDAEGGATKSAASKKGAAKKGAGKGATKGRASRKGGGDGDLADAEASVGSRPARGEFGRRGGRRRRRGGKPPEGEGGATGADGANGQAEEVSDVEETQHVEASPIIEAVEAAEPVAADVDAPAVAEGARPTRSESGRGGRGGREGGRDGGRDGRDTRDSRGGRGGERGGRDARPGGGGDGPRGDATRGDGRDNRGGRDNRDARGGRDNREGQNREGQGREGQGREGQGGREGRGERGGRRGAPMITDLLREGQEILVQIAKEPISQKGARITSHIALPGRYLVYMPTIEHVGVSRKIESDSERQRLRKLIANIRATEDVPAGGFIVRTAGIGITEENLRDDARYLVRTWRDIRREAEKKKAPSLVHADLDLVQRILRDQLSEDFAAIRCDTETEYQEIVEFVNRIQPRLVNRVKLYTREEPILEAFGVQAEIDKAIKPRVWLRSGGYLVINQTEALVSIDVNTGKFVGRGGSRLEDTITKTNLEAVDEIARQIRLRDLGGIIVLDLIDMEDRRNRNRVMGALQDALRDDKSPTKVLSFNDFGLVIMTRKRVKQSLERTLCSPCPYCQGAGLVKSPQTICYEILEEARRLSRGLDGDEVKQATLRVHPEVARALRSTESDVLAEVEDYLGGVDVTGDPRVHQEQFDFALV
ncbi:MAG TPA: Rne/Rng family ribonuclease [Pyrinomonadaceae bacterium]|nr:Rne/Rng family ribonuclease [Pyrinomonadaceae bacterium]